eukprot:CAMPEP_0118666384 /NCGR_PEP_ID=MMETSP0785-20121206/19181_1 /TAXON_ID=91992 /ORGANISM="Bolidomonas pacifica, Strain CCMP 1866" /LENGTH=132 /DNA_ID=CAMNT_0006560681 /DNA_START=926 /DNA_END=1325 /DNA_ORIENTATION=-
MPRVVSPGVGDGRAAAASDVDDNIYIGAEEGRAREEIEVGEGANKRSREKRGVLATLAVDGEAAASASSDQRGDKGVGARNENIAEEVGAESNPVKSDKELDQEDLERIANVIRNEEQVYSEEEKRAIREGK